jgi:hypothetical protein
MPKEEQLPLFPEKNEPPPQSWVQRRLKTIWPGYDKDVCLRAFAIASNPKIATFTSDDIRCWPECEPPADKPTAFSDAMRLVWDLHIVTDAGGIPENTVRPQAHGRVLRILKAGFQLGK